MLLHATFISNFMQFNMKFILLFFNKNLDFKICFFFCVPNLKQHWFWAVQYEICTWFSQRGFENGENFIWSQFGQVNLKSLKFSLLFSNKIFGFLLVGVCYLMQRLQLILCSSIWNLSCSSPTFFCSSPTRANPVSFLCAAK